MSDTGIGPTGYHATYYLDRDWTAYTEILARIIRHSQPGPILDLGAGCGYLVEAATRWGLSATGLEGAPEALALAKVRAPSLDIRPQRLSERLPLADNSYQTVVLNQVIEHLEPETARHVARESLRVLRPGGMLLVTAPSKANVKEAKADPTHINMMSPSELRGLLLGQGFSRTASFDSPLPLLGRGRVAFGIVSAFFKLTAVERLSATANIMAFKDAAGPARAAVASIQAAAPPAAPT